MRYAFPTDTVENLKRFDRERQGLAPDAEVYQYEFSWPDFKSTLVFDSVSRGISSMHYEGRTRYTINTILKRYPGGTK